ncbi:hypothetical protein RHGRI_035655 [Rhododendron griersonianum]|uniref:UBC core domain-containing protein n=1 Tax=Rhododendron griersonianum TaxID=479676 RepID=A0AAV6HKP6_9ERIC|nr:hypothetical protein RHGRI_035655 [Rhododendron griersonianum]
MDVNGFEANPSYGEIEEIQDEIDKRFKNFKKFDIISDPPFNRQFDKKKPINKHSPLGISSQLTEKLQEECVVLEANLPNSILLRAYENRTDLMSAVIIGPPKTPYYHALFFVDILFPSNYPTCPPKLFCQSQGLDLNHPSLQPDGKLFLSLLETGEHWDPNQANLLQVLVAIRRLALNFKPYFTESEKREYNRNAIIFTSEAIVRTLERPPRDFEDFVAGHFRQRAHAILMNYKEHMDESKGMTQLFIKLLRVLEGTGAYCLTNSATAPFSISAAFISKPIPLI